MNTFAESRTTVFVSLANVTRPSGLSDFKRWKVAIPNEAGLKGAPSYRSPYMVDESSDMVGVDHKITADFFAALDAQGYAIVLK